MSGKTPPPPPPTPPPISSTGADQAQAALTAKQREKKRFDFSKTIIGGGMGADGTKSTLG